MLEPFSGHIREFFVNIRRERLRFMMGYDVLGLVVEFLGKGYSPLTFDGVDAGPIHKDRRPTLSEIAESVLLKQVVATGSNITYEVPNQVKVC